MVDPTSPRTPFSNLKNCVSTFWLTKAQRMEYASSSHNLVSVYNSGKKTKQISLKKRLRIGSARDVERRILGWAVHAYFFLV